MSLILLGNIGGGGTGTSGPITADEITDAKAVGRAVLTADDAAAARAALGAGTGSSDLALGTTSSTAMPGNKTAADIGGVPAARTVAGLPLSGDVLAVDLLNALPAATTSAKGPVELATTTEATTGTDDTRAVTPAGVAAAIALLTSGAPGLLNTLTEIDAAIGNDPNFATTMTTALAGKVPTSRMVNGQPLTSDVTITSVTSATKLGTARTINGVGFDGTANITVHDTSTPYIIYWNATTKAWPTPAPPAGYALDYYIFDSYSGSAYDVTATTPTPVHTGDLWRKAPAA